MSLALALAGLGAPFTSSLAVRWFELRHWRHTLMAFRLYLPCDLTSDAVARWLTTIAATTHPPRWSMFPQAPMVFEARASYEGIAHVVLVAPSMYGALLAGVQAALPGARLEEDPDYLRAPHRVTVAREATLTSRVRRLAIERTESVSAALVAALQPLGPGEQIILQLILTSAGTPEPIPSKWTASKMDYHWWFTGTASTDPEALRAHRLKQQDPLLLATLRMGVVSRSPQHAQALLARSWAMLQGLNVPGARIVQRWLPPLLIQTRLRARSYPALHWPLLLNVREASALLALPFGAYLPGLTTGRARQLPPPPALPAHGNVVGVSDYPGMTDRTLALGTPDRLRHVHIIGPTGTGKSTLLARMALQDIASGHGVVVVDLKGDLIRDIAARIPPARQADVALLDPVQPQTAIIGFNPLRGASSAEATRELLAEQVLAIFHAIYRDFWGPRTDEILRAALFSLVHTDAPDGSAFTLIEVPEMLTNPHFRQYVCAHPMLPPSLRAFWQWFDGSLKDSDRIQATGPVLNKLRAFSMRERIRLMLGQSEGITFDHVVGGNGVLLISLASGVLGSEAAHLLGSLFVASLWHATQARIAIPPEQRRPIFAYLDEFQELVRLEEDTSLADMLAQARGLGLSLTLAHQYLSQMPTAVREAALGTVRTHIAFQLEWDNAVALEGRFEPLTRDDLAGLDPYTFALKPCVNGQTLRPMTGATLPLDEPLQDSAILAQMSQARYGLARSVVEAGLRARLGKASPVVHERFGREIMGASR